MCGRPSSMPVAVGNDSPVRVALLDLLMAVMNSVSVWTWAAGGRERGLAWRDGVTARMVAHPAYRPYEELVAAEAAVHGLPPRAPERLLAALPRMRPWPDATAIRHLRVPYAFLTNCSAALADLAGRRSELDPAFTLSAEEAGWYKPDPRAYLAACERFGVPPEEVMFVAGSPYDARGAAAAGLFTRLVDRRPDQGPPGGQVELRATLHEVVDELAGRYRLANRC